MRLLSLPGVYRPDADSAMLVEHLRKTTRPGERVLDVFTGTGVIAIGAATAGAGSVCAVDVSRRAALCTWLNSRLNGVRVSVRLGNLLEPVGRRRFDTITANPPYVPSVGGDDAPRGAARAWEGGADGRALLDPFIAAAPKHLTPGGRILVVHSSVSGIERTVEMFEEVGLNTRIAHQVEIPLGPLAAARADILEERGRLAPGSRTERVAIIEAHSPIEVGDAVGQVTGNGTGAEEPA